MSSSKKAKVVTIGAAVQDVFLSGNTFTPHKEENGWVEEFPLGAKLDVDGITFSTGGGATNAAVTFARQGIDTAFMGKIGSDPAGAAVKTALMHEDVDISALTYSKKYATGYSVLLLAPNGERTILTYRGASTHYREENFKLESVSPEWFYISSLSGNLDVLEHIVDYAHSNDIKVAINPGKGELKQTKRLIKLLPKFDLLSLNKEEMAHLVESEEPLEMLRAISSYVEYAVITDGPNGSWATDGVAVVKAGMYEDVEVIDRTGAGDAFCSGFTAAIINNQSLEEAVVLASANSTGVVRYIGAKKGILRDTDKLHDMELDIQRLE